MSEMKADGCGVADCPAERKLKWMRFDLDEARQQRDKAIAERDEARRATQAAQEDNRKLCLEAAQAAAERDRLAGKLAETKADRDDVASRAWKLRCEQAKLKVERDELAGKVAGLTQDVELMRADRDAVLARSNASKLALAGKIDELRERARAREEHAAVLQRKLGDARSEVEELKCGAAASALEIDRLSWIAKTCMAEADKLRALKAATAASAAPLKPAEPCPACRDNRNIQAVAFDGVRCMACGREITPVPPKPAELDPARFIRTAAPRTAGPTVAVKSRDGQGAIMTVATDVESLTITF